MSDKDLKTTTQEELPLTGYSWIIALLCSLTWIVSFISRNVWSTALPIAAPELGLTMTAAGGLMTAFYIGYVAGNFFTGFVVDSIGPRKTLATASILTGTFTLLIPFVSGYGPIFVLRILAGFSAGPLFAGGTKMQLAWFPVKARATAMQFVMSGPAIGMAIAAAGFAPIIQNQGWKQGFIVAGIVTVVVGVITFLAAKERGIAKIRTKKANTKTVEEKKEERKTLMGLIFRKQFVLGSFGQLLAVGAMNGFLTWIILYFTQVQGFTPIEAGSILGATSAVALFSGTISGFISDILKTRKKVVYIGCIAQFVSVMGLLLTKNITLLWVFMFLRVLIGAFAGNLNTIMAESNVGPYAGRTMGIYNMFCQLGSVIFPVFLGLILDITGSFFVVLTTVASTYLVMGVLVFFMEETAVREVKKAA